MTNIFTKLVTVLIFLIALKLFLVISSLAQEVEPLDDFTILNGKVVKLYKTGKFTQAILLAGKVLGQMEAQLGSEHSLLRAPLNNLAALHTAHGRFSEAEVLYVRAAKIAEKTLGPTHSIFVTSLITLASCYEAQELYNEAEYFYKRALSIREKKYGDAHPDVIVMRNILVAFYEAQNKFTNAESLINAQ